MTSTSYIDYICEKHLTMNKDDMRGSLLKLNEIIRRELQEIPQSEIPKSILNKVKKYIKKSFNLTFEAIVESNLCDYEKTYVLIEACRVFNSEYREINIIPNHLFMVFWSFVENPKMRIQITEDGQQFIAL